MFSMPTPTATMREDFERVERLKEKGATTIYSRANNPDGTGRHHGLLTYMGFYDLLPTVQATDYNTTLSPEAKQRAIERHPDVVPSCTYQLRQMAADGLLPTPRANVVNGCDLNNPKLAERHKSNLEEEVAKMVTTNLLPTTIARDWKGGTTAKREDQDRQRTDQLDSLIKIMESQVTPDGSPSRLSPLFTEEMMGFPLMWTALPFLSESGAPKPSKPTATPSSPK